MLSGQSITDVIISRLMESGKLIRSERVGKGWSQAELGKRVGVSQVAIKKIEAGRTIKSKHLPKIAELLSIPLSKLDPSLSQHGLGTANHSDNDTPRKTRIAPPPTETFGHNARIGAAVSGFARVPIRGQTMGGKDGALIFNADEYFGEVEAPSKLAGVPDAYAAYVVGDSMLERYQHGEVVYVHPYAPVKKNDYVVIQIQVGDHGAVHGWVKRFVSRDDTTLKVLQLNPRKTLSFPNDRVVHVHKIVGAGEP